MAKPKDEGFPYSQQDTNIYFEPKIRMLLSRFGCDGYCVWDYIKQAAYSEHGYFVEWNDDRQELTAADLTLSAEKTGLIVAYLLKRSLLISKSFNGITVLTSHGIQKRFQNMAKSAKREYYTFYPEIWLLSETETLHSIFCTQNQNNSGIKGDNSGIKADNSGIKGQKERKEKESKKEEKIYKKESEVSEEEVESIEAAQMEIPFLIGEESNFSEKVITKSEIEGYFEKIYEIYPKKVSKVLAKETFEHKLRGYTSKEGHKKARQIYKMLDQQNVAWSGERNGAGREFEMIPHFSTWLNENVENSPKYRRGKG